MRTKWALISLGFAAMLAAMPAAWAADYPTRPIKFVVPYVAGGPTDAQARIFAEYLARDLKQSVFVENKGGAQGAIGAEAVAHGDADGYSAAVDGAGRDHLQAGDVRHRCAGGGWGGHSD